SPAAGLKSGQFDRKRIFGFAELIKKRISNSEYPPAMHITLGNRNHWAMSQIDKLDLNPF
ncbi:MAG: hypothetical protein PVJ56_06220, partial [Desulfobacterales bacterium]